MKSYIWKRVKTTSGRLAWVLVLAALGACAPQRHYSRSHAAYAAMSDEQLDADQNECDDTDDMNPREIARWKKINGCAGLEAFISIGVRFK